MPDTNDITFINALEKVASYMWPVGRGYTKEEIEAMPRKPVKKEVKPEIKGTRYNGEEE